MPQLSSRTWNIERSLPSRLVVQLPIEARWSERGAPGQIVIEGVTESIGLGSALVNLKRLPEVGSKIVVSIGSGESKPKAFEAEVIRVERDPAQPRAALSITAPDKTWRDLVMETARVLSTKKTSEAEDDDWLN